jgi:hypothetical protein
LQTRRIGLGSAARYGSATMDIDPSRKASHQKAVRAARGRSSYQASFRDVLALVLGRQKTYD